MHRTHTETKKLEAKLSRYGNEQKSLLNRKTGLLCVGRKCWCSVSVDTALLLWQGLVSLSLSLSPSHTHTNTHTRTNMYSFAHTHTHSPFLSLSLSFMHSLMFFLGNTCYNFSPFTSTFISLSLSLSLHLSLFLVWNLFCITLTRAILRKQLSRNRAES